MIQSLTEAAGLPVGCQLSPLPLCKTDNNAYISNSSFTMTLKVILAIVKFYQYNISAITLYNSLYA